MQSRSIAACSQALVTKHNKLIQARYGLSLQEKRLILWLVSAIRPGDTDFHSYRVSVRQLAELLGLEKNKNIYAQVAAVTRRLMRRVIEIEKLDEKCFLQIHWLSSAEYHLGQGCVDLCFDPKLKPYLLQLKDQFTSIALQYAIQLKSLYAIRIYELLKQYQRLRERTLAVAELHRRLKSRRPIANPAAWLVQGIRDDYRPQPSLFAQAEEQRRRAVRGRAERAEEIRTALAVISKAYRGYLLPAIERFLAQRRSQAAEDLAGLEQDFQATLQSHFAREQFRASGWRAPTLFNDAATFFCQRYPATFLSKAAYAQQHNLGDPESLAAELAQIESETRQHPNAAASGSMIATDDAA